MAMQKRDGDSVVSCDGDAFQLSSSLLLLLLLQGMRLIAHSNCEDSGYMHTPIGTLTYEYT